MKSRDLNREQEQVEAIRSKSLNNQVRDLNREQEQVEAIRSKSLNNQVRVEENP